MAVGGVLSNLDLYERLVVDAILQGATGGTLDLTLQRLIGAGVWADWLHWPQLAAGAASIQYTCTSTAYGDGTIHVVTGGTTAAPTPTTGATGFILPGHPGDTVRLVAVAGAGTTAGKSQSFGITGWLPPS